MSKFDKFQRVLVSLLIAISFFYGGYYFGQRGYVYEIRRNPPKIEITNRYPSDSKVDFSLFWEVWDLLNTTYLERPIDAQKMMQGAISGMVNSLDDPYTSYLSPELNKAMNDALNGTYQGIGAELGMRDGHLIIVAPLDGSPAKAAGVMAGDRILEIEGESSAGITINEAVSKIRGDAGTVSTLKLQRGDTEPFTISINRGVITTESVIWEDKGDGTAYIRVNRFGGDTNREWARVVSEVNVRMLELDAIVVDVRGNPGGYLQSAVYISDEFIKSGTALYEESPTGQQTAYNVDRRGIFEDIPGIFVLVDGGSASASEIVAAALRDNRGAVIVGTQSFGKGTIQDAKDFKDGSGVHITIAKWLTPEKEWVHKVGLEPDHVVEITDEDLNSETDPQLEKALELAREY